MVSSLLREMGAGDEVSIVGITVIFKKAVVDMLILGAIYYHTCKHIKHICFIVFKMVVHKISHPPITSEHKKDNHAFKFSGKPEITLGG